MTYVYYDLWNDNFILLRKEACWLYCGQKHTYLTEWPDGTIFRSLDNDLMPSRYIKIGVL